MRLTTRGRVSLFVAAGLLGLTAHLWNPWAITAHDIIERDRATQQEGATGQHGHPQ